MAFSRVPTRVFVVLAGVVASGALALSGAGAMTRAPVWVNTGPEGGYLGGYYEAIAIHPASPRVVYASTYHGLFRSTDGGATWHRRQAPSWLLQVALDPEDPQTLYAIANGSLWRTRNAGSSWARLPGPQADYVNLILVTVSASSPQTVYAVSHGGPGVRVFSSTDAGASWVTAGRIDGAGGYQPAEILVDPRNPSTVYVRVWVKGIFRSEDGGMTWAKASAGLAVGKLSSLAAHPTKPGLLYAGDERGEIFRSADSGRSWARVARGLAGDVTDIAVSGADGAVYAGTSPPYRADGIDAGGGVVYRSADGRAPWPARSAGLTGWNVRSLAAHPSSPGTLLAGTEHGVFGTRDGGATWVERVKGLAATSPTGLVVDPSDPRSVLAAVERGVAVSRDGGRTWGDSLDLRSERVDVGSLLAVPGTPALVYAVKRSHTVPKPRSALVASQDAGRTWVEVGALPGPTAYTGAPGTTLVADPASESTLYFVARGIFRSIDTGRTWTRIYSPVGKPHAVALAVDPFDPEVLYASVAVSWKSSRSGLLISENGGRTWRRLDGYGTGNPMVLAADPHRRGTLYAVQGGWFTEVRVSRDSGRTWSKLGKAPFDSGSLLVDPVRPGVVYVGTQNGVYVKSRGSTTWRAAGPAGREVQLLTTDVKAHRLYAGIAGGGVAATRLPLAGTDVRSVQRAESP